MKKLLLLISFLSMGFPQTFCQKITNPAKSPYSVDTTKGKLKANSKSTSHHYTEKRNKTKKQTAIIHNGPDQQKIDSIKKEKLKHKR